MITDWQEFWMTQAYLWALKSKDPATKVGAVVVKDNRLLSAGYNDLPKGASHDVPSRYERPEKYLYIVHAERNAINNAAATGVNIHQSTMYVNYFPCQACFTSVINSGVNKLIYHSIYPGNTGEIFEETFAFNNELAIECGVELVAYNKPIKWLPIYYKGTVTSFSDEGETTHC